MDHANTVYSWLSTKAKCDEKNTVEVRRKLAQLETMATMTKQLNIELQASINSKYEPR